MNKVSLLVIGAGAAGISAACAAREAGCESVLLVDANPSPGGILLQCAHSGFGERLFGRELTGPEFAERLLERLERAAPEIMTGTTVTDVFPDRTALLSGRNGAELISFDRLILAAGCRELTIGSLDVSGTRPFGVYTAGEAQRMINLGGESIGSEVVILGSGDLGLIMARRFTLEGRHVRAVVEKNATFSAMARNYRRCVEAYGIPVMYSSELAEIIGEPRISAVKIRHEDGASETLSCDTLVTAIGLVPDTVLADSLGSPPWLSLCGNCSRIHSLVDSAVDEAEKTGRACAG